MRWIDRRWCCSPSCSRPYSVWKCLCSHTPSLGTRSLLPVERGRQEPGQALFYRQKKTRQEPGQITVISLMRRFSESPNQGPFRRSTGLATRWRNHNNSHFHVNNCLLAFLEVFVNGRFSLCCQPIKAPPADSAPLCVLREYRSSEHPVMPLLLRTAALLRL